MQRRDRTAWKTVATAVMKYNELSLLDLESDLKLGYKYA